MSACFLARYNGMFICAQENVYEKPFLLSLHRILFPNEQRCKTERQFGRSTAAKNRVNAKYNNENKFRYFFTWPENFLQDDES